MSALHEIVFAVFFASVVAVGAMQPGAYSEGLLAGLLSILLLNLWFFLYRKGREPSRGLMRAYLSLNCLATFLILSCSGGRESMFWVAFLLPVLSACVSDKVSPWPVVGLGATLLAALYGGVRPGMYDLAEWAMKAGTLAFAAAVTRRTFLSEQGLRSSVDSKRMHLEYLASKMLQEHHPIQTEGTLREQVEKRLRLLENPLSVLFGSAQLVQLSAPEAVADVKRIEACHRLIKSLTQDLFDIVYHDEFWIEKGSFEEAYRSVLADLKYPLAVKEIKFIENFEGDLPVVPMSRIHIQQLLHSIMSRAVLSASHGDRFEVQARLAGLGDEPYLESAFVHPGLGDVFSLSHLRRIAERHGGWLQLEYLTRSVRYTLALPLRQGAKLPPGA